MSRAFVVMLTLLSFAGVSFAGSIILPFWQDEEMPIYSMFIIWNTSFITNDQVSVMFYGDSGNPETRNPIEKTISVQNVELFGTAHYPQEPKLITSNVYGYAIASETGGSLKAIGIIYDDRAKAGFVIPCFKGNDRLHADPGW